MSEMPVPIISGATHVAPLLPEGIHPKLTFEPLHALVH